MKKIAIILITQIYLLVFSGISVSMHFCGGELNSLSLVGVNPNCGCDEEDDQGCCHDSHYYFKVSTEHQQAKSVEKLPIPVVADVETYHSGFFSEKWVSSTFIFYDSQVKPPGQPHCRKHILIGRITC